ncbi:MAG: hypothetical protein Q4F05_03745 [bacterium]|nr:hypothetical protein [bacterium]
MNELFDIVYEWFLKFKTIDYLHMTKGECMFIAGWLSIAVFGIWTIVKICRFPHRRKKLIKRIENME